MLEALVDYYEILAKDGKIARPGYCTAGVSFALELSPEGDLIGVIPLKIEVQRGKSKIELPQKLMVPEQVKRAVNISANFLCDNAAYVLGLNLKDNPERAKKCFEDFKKLHEKILEELNCPAAHALLRFLEKWRPEAVVTNFALQDYLMELSKGGEYRISSCRRIFAR